MAHAKPNKPANKFWHGGFHISSSPIDGAPRLAFQHLSTAKRVAQERTDDGFPCYYRQPKDEDYWEVVQKEKTPDK